MRIKISFKLAYGILAALAGLHAANVRAADQSPIQITIAAKLLRLQNYAGGGVVIWNSGSLCSLGQLSGAALSSTEQSRLYAQVLASKMAAGTVFFTYEVVNSVCSITSFGQDN